MKADQNGAYYDTLKWIAYQKWNSSKRSSPEFECPHGDHQVPGLSFDSDEAVCPHCKGTVFLTDVIGFHLDMGEDCAPESVASAYMLIMELLMLFTAVRLYWDAPDKNLVSETLFIKDGPLTLRGQYSKLVPAIRDFFEFSKSQKRPVHLIGQEKTGTFADHLGSIVRFAPPHARGEKPSYAVLTHDYIRREVYRAPDRTNPYGMRTNWGEKMYVKIDPGAFMTTNVPTGRYDPRGDFPRSDDLIGLKRILATLPTLVSHKFEGALFPVELANGVASMSSYPSAKVLQLFAGF
jgi:hypothetical protein